MIGSKAGNGALLDSSTQPEDRLNQFLLPVEAQLEEHCHTTRAGACMLGRLQFFRRHGVLQCGLGWVSRGHKFFFNHL